jgi:hypothetical protein
MQIPKFGLVLVLVVVLVLDAQAFLQRKRAAHEEESSISEFRLNAKDPRSTSERGS